MTSWIARRPIPPPSVEHNEVHVWRIPCGEAGDLSTSSTSGLSEAERRRRREFRFAVDRTRFTQRHVATRIILGAYVGVAGRDVRFALGPFGKPELADHPGWHFNLSHSDDLALLALTRLAAVGVDIERARPLPDLEPIARRHFAPAEADRILAQPDPRRRAAFYRCWVRKEAFTKALGTGLSTPLGDFEVSTEEGPEAQVVRTGPSLLSAVSWTLIDLQPAPCFAAALAICARDVSVRTLHYADRV